MGKVLSNNKEQFDKCPKHYVRWVVVTAGMVFVFFAYLIYSNITGFDIDAPSTELVNGISKTVTQNSVIQTAAVGTSVSPSAFLGVEIVSIDKVIAEQLGIQDVHGVLVNSVISGSPAEKAGLKRGDVIAVINTTATRTVEIFKEVMAALKPGDTVRITYLRDGQKARTYATLTKLPATMLTAQTTNTDITDNTTWGASLSAITSNLRTTYSIPHNINGVVIVSVVPGGAAADAGLAPGDVIVGIDGTSISDIDDFFNAVASDKDGTALLDVYSHGQYRYIPIASLAVDNPLHLSNGPVPIGELSAYDFLFRAVPLVGVVGLIIAAVGYFYLFKNSPGDAKLKWILFSAAGVVVWWLIYSNLSAFAGWFTYSLLKMEQGRHISSAVEFFVFEVPKVLMLLVIVVFVTGIIRSFFTPEKTRAILSSKTETVGNVLAALLGVVTPFCSCSAVPLFVGFVTAGVPLGVTFSFLISAPMINEVALVLLFGMFGWKVAALYMGVGLLIAIVAGWILGRLHMEKYIEPWVFQTQIGESTGHQVMNWQDRINYGLTAVRDIISKVWIYVILGIAVGAGIHGYVPQDFMASFMGKDTWWSVPLAVLLGVPMYSNAAGIIPVVKALLEKGAALGTVLAFMMAVIGLSLPEAIILRNILKPRLIFTFFGIVAAGIIIIGYLFNIVF